MFGRVILKQDVQRSHHREGQWTETQAERSSHPWEEGAGRQSEALGGAGWTGGVRARGPERLECSELSEGGGGAGGGRGGLGL